MNAGLLGPDYPLSVHCFLMDSLEADDGLMNGLINSIYCADNQYLLTLFFDRIKYIHFYCVYGLIIFLRYRVPVKPAGSFREILSGGVCGKS